MASKHVYQIITLDSFVIPKPIKRSERAHIYIIDDDSAVNRSRLMVYIVTVTLVFGKHLLSTER